MTLSLVPNLRSFKIVPTRLGLVESLSVTAESADSVAVENFEPQDIDEWITVPATIVVVVFALVIIIICTLKKGRSDGFGAPR